MNLILTRPLRPEYAHLYLDRDEGFLFYFLSW